MKNITKSKSFTDIEMSSYSYQRTKHCYFKTIQKQGSYCDGQTQMYEKLHVFINNKKFQTSR